jgi:hypothetical protein
VTLKLREQQALFRDRKRVGLARVRMTLHLDERSDALTSKFNELR